MSTRRKPTGHSTGPTKTLLRAILLACCCDVCSWLIPSGGSKKHSGLLLWTAQAFTAQLQRPWEQVRSRSDTASSGGLEDVVVLLGLPAKHSSRLPLYSKDPKRTDDDENYVNNAPDQVNYNDRPTNSTSKQQQNNLHSSYSPYSSSSSSSGDATSNTHSNPVHQQLHTATHHQFDSVSLSSMRNNHNNHNHNNIDQINGGPMIDVSGATHTVWNSLGPLLKMTRPENLPGVVLFHMVGVYLALQQQQHVASSISYWTLLLQQPMLWLTLVALILTSSTSMVVNDYYDAKLGRDDHKHKPLVDGDIPMSVARQFLRYLYGAALLLVALLPGIPTRLSVMGGLMLTYLYTQHLKPKTWWKNIVCATLIALSPLTSGSAALHVMYPTTNFCTQVFTNIPLWRLVSTLFCGIFSREILMDCNDYDNDKEANILTIPVVHGRKMATSVAMVASIGMAISAVSGPLLQLIHQSSAIPALLTSTGDSFPLWTFLSWGPMRRLTLASVASGMVLRRSYQVCRTQGSNQQVIDRAVQEGLLTVLVLLASFV